MFTRYTGKNVGTLMVYLWFTYMAVLVEELMMMIGKHVTRIKKDY